MQRFLLMLVLVLTFVAPAKQAQAWSERGHRLVAELAYARLNAHAREAVDRLTLSDATASPGCPVHSFAEASLWSDCVRQIAAYRNQSSWHYDNIPMCGASTYRTYCANGDCATAAIARAERTLRQRRGSERDQARALARLVHFIGDIHQPLHAVNNDDRGGNDVRTGYSPSGAWPGATGAATNLHAVWDRTLVDYALGPDEIPARGEIDALMRAHAHDWSMGSSRSWAAEAHQLAVSSAYGALPNPPVCGHSLSEVAVLPLAYAEANAPIVRQQLARAALRLAARLKVIYP